MNFIKPKKCPLVTSNLLSLPKREQLERELFELENQLDIPYKDRFYNRKRERRKK